jgi:N-methylhydantoinase A
MWLTVSDWNTMGTKASQGLRVAVDIGGTFTDLAYYAEGSQEVGFAKSASTPRSLVDGVQNCLTKVGVDPARILHLIHGSTVAINAVIQRTGAKTALITTEGFGDVYEIGRANRPDTYNLFFEKPIPLIPRILRLEVRERMSPSGEVIRPLDTKSVAAAVRRLKQEAIEAVAVCLIHSYANPAHEVSLGHLLREELPHVFTTLSHEILREFREYERTSTTVLNAFIGPIVRDYLDQLERPLHTRRFHGKLFIMQSNGGVMTADRAKVAPVAMMESGPAGGVIGAAHLGRLLGHENLIAFDMGGTTAKACLVEQGLPKVADGYYIGGYTSGYPMRLPVVDIVEVGTGGGSIAWMDPGGALKVGPMSAGAEPGPVCYGRGGMEPTVTDSNLVIGRLSSSSFLGGEVVLDTSGATRVIEERVAKPFGMDLTEAAHGIVKIADALMSFAVRAITVQRGYDPRDFVMVAFGGAGPLHALAIARELRIPRVIVPPYPGHFSAVGMLLTDFRHDYVQTYVRHYDALTADEIEAAFHSLTAEGSQTLISEGVAAGNTAFIRSMEMRYLGQEYTVTIPVPGTIDTQATLLEVRRRFDEAYDKRYGHSAPSEPIELVNLRVTALGTVRKPEFTHLRGPKGDRLAQVQTRRVAFQGDTDQYIDCPVLRREEMTVDTDVVGPAIIEEYASTTVLHPGDSAMVEPNGCLVIEIGSMEKSVL